MAVFDHDGTKSIGGKIKGLQDRKLGALCINRQKVDFNRRIARAQQVDQADRRDLVKHMIVPSTALRLNIV